MQFLSDENRMDPLEQTYTDHKIIEQIEDNRRYSSPAEFFLPTLRDFACPMYPQLPKKDIFSWFLMSTSLFISLKERNTSYLKMNFQIRDFWNW